ncbi:hypothetical protein IU443_02850 [Nocardia farcinica]|uniref:hypothetical protein n=1 Tax=Nocardia farcinica TaxID=37329 RepID=UPI0011156713|nr:hypothetical protein [Nocardia farcinica]MBA4854470.1 hypothetical protein [Nocardia farcinica]MBC9814655.1 hypothetical protein [Nocardia farcinica]MBF6230652.1 hypothetical protein [Nocardia farcinica]MBF6249504.1 hypothetical protein [Nocardia farcinica]MBF6256072.1 hypothetical protein [Nocardia farcinica]
MTAEPGGGSPDHAATGTSTHPSKTRRAIAVLRSDHDPAVYDALTRAHPLRIVYTVHTDAAALLAARIGVHHALEHAADAAVVPHLGTLEPDSPWWLVTQVADLITGKQIYSLRSATSTQRRSEH